VRLGAAAAVAVCLGAGLAYVAQLRIPASYLSGAFAFGVAALAAAILWLRMPRNTGKNRAWVCAVCFFLCADLLYAGWGLNPAGHRDVYREDSPHQIVQEALAGSRIYMRARDERILKFDKLFRFDRFASDARIVRASLLPNLNILDGISSANNFDPLLPRRYTEWVAAMETARRDVREQMLAAMNVGMVASVIDIEGAAVSFESMQPLPRARLVVCARGVGSSGEVLRQILAREVDLAQTVLLEGAPDATSSDCAEPGSAFVTSEGANWVAIYTESDAPAWLVLADTAYPGWQATVNGSAVPIYTADGIFRAVQVPAGASAVEFTFRPLSFTAGLLLTALAWPALGIAWSRQRA
jgi:hypothetical protein